MNDEEIGRLFEQSGPPPRRPGYWEDIQDALAAIDDERAGGSAVTAPAELDRENLDTDANVIRLEDMNDTVQRSWDRRGSRIWFVAAAVVAVVLLGVAAIQAGRSSLTEVADPADDSQPAPDTEAPSPTTVPQTEEPSTTTAPTTDDAAVTSAPAAAEDAGSESDGAPADTTVPGPLQNQAEPDLVFDYGALVRLTEVDGRRWIWFDRYSFDGKAGPELTEEVGYALGSDMPPHENVNPGLRTYPVADAAVLHLIERDVYDAVCGGDTGPEEWYTSGTVEEMFPLLLQTDPFDGTGSMLVSLVFDDDNEVVEIRDNRLC
ncbi:MAG: hypothetical protein AAF547_20655 [Actinomycetota bacterium]